MGNCATGKELPNNSASAMGEHPKSAASSHQYSSMNLGAVLADISKLENTFLRHAVLTWAVVPLFGSLQAFVPFLEPTCAEGFRDITLIFVVLYEAHHIWSERLAWYATMSLVAPPEVTVLRHLGVLRKRKAYFILGIIESLDLYTDVTFPFVARSCEAHLTARWQATWAVVPVIGKVMVSVLSATKFWGFCLILAALNVVVTGGIGLVQMHMAKKNSSQKDLSADGRISGEVFFQWAQSAETAMMPSVAMLSEEIASERKYKYDSDKDASKAMEARAKVSYGNTTAREALEMELADEKEEERIAHASKWHFIVLMLVKVLLGNCMQLWLHSSFYALTFDISGKEAKIKVIISMIASATQALIRCKLIIPKLGGLGFLLSFIAVFVVAWSGAKVYYTYNCPSHLWNISSGCVTIDGNGM